MPRLAVAALALLLLNITWAPSYAQENLLNNPGFNEAGGYSPAAPYFLGDFTFAPGWNGWKTNSPQTAVWQNIDPIAFPHTGEFALEGGVSQNIGRGDATFTAAAYQEVFNIAEGTTLRATARVYQDNNSDGSDARTRIGIGSNVQGNPLSGNITWSQWTRDRGGWATISVEATVPAGSVTLFIYSTQSAPASGNQVYYDDAELVITGSGDVNVGDGTGGDQQSDPVVPPPPTTPPQVFAPFVSAQNADSSGRIEHVVQAGDTLAAIAVAYGVPVSEIRELNNIAGSNLRIGDVLLIQEAPPPTAAPPTSAPAADESGAADDIASDPPAASNSAQRDAVALGNAQAPESPQADEAAADSAGAAASEPSDPPTSVAQTEAEPAQPTAPPTATTTTTLVTPTPLAPPPVEAGAEDDPLATEADVCVALFDDLNLNRIRDLDEALLANGIVELASQTRDNTLQYTTDGENEPYCFAGLQPDTYTISATAPDGYGITTAPRLMLNAQPGQRLQLAIGAAVGVEPVIIPTADTAALTDEAAAPTPENNDPANLRNIVGVLVLGLAVVVLVGGIGVAFMARRL